MSYCLWSSCKSLGADSKQENPNDVIKAEPEIYGSVADYEQPSSDLVQDSQQQNYISLADFQPQEDSPFTEYYKNRNYISSKDYQQASSVNITASGQKNFTNYTTIPWILATPVIVATPTIRIVPAIQNAMVIAVPVALETVLITVAPTALETVAIGVRTPALIVMEIPATPMM